MQLHLVYQYSAFTVVPVKYYTIIAQENSHINVHL